MKLHNTYTSLKFVLEVRHFLKMLPKNMDDERKNFLKRKLLKKCNEFLNAQPNKGSLWVHRNL